MSLCSKNEWEREKMKHRFSSGIWVRALCCSVECFSVALCCTLYRLNLFLDRLWDKSRSSTHMLTVYCNRQTAIRIKTLFHTLPYTCSPSVIICYDMESMRREDQWACQLRQTVPAMKTCFPPLCLTNLFPLKYHKRDSHSQQQQWFLISLKFHLPTRPSLSWRQHEWALLD